MTREDLKDYRYSEKWIREQLQWRLDAYERLQDCDEEFEL